jgi:oxygen-independent coproporphyrinogen-3 oxidase
MRHLYVHVPFCLRRCSYCDFSIAVRKRIPAREYVDAVVQELRLVGIPDAGGEVLETIYFGGGTPSLLPPDALATLLTSLRDAFDVTSFRDVVEVTLEANPEDVTRDAATAWCRAGINRVSLGAQSFDDGVLQWMHRSHDAARIGAAVRTLRAAGIDNISLDLIFALPAGLERDWARDLEQALALLPNHLSLYGLTVEERTPLARWISRGAAAPPDDDRYAEEYWSGRPYRGLGPAAHSFDGAARRWNLSAWEAYRSAVAAGRSPVASQEALSDEQRELERVYLALRTDAGLPVATLSRPLPPSAALWVERGWAETRSDRLVCTPEGWLRLDALVRDLTGCGTTS